MVKVYKYRLYPNQKQIISINKYFECGKFIYNWALNRKVKTYQKEKSKPFCFTFINYLPKLKEVQFDFKTGKISFPKIGKINALLYKKFEGRIKTCILFKAIDEYYISIVVNDRKKIIKNNSPSKSIIAYF